jgi:hypothetical protein
MQTCKVQRVSSKEIHARQANSTHSGTVCFCMLVKSLFSEMLSPNEVDDRSISNAMVGTSRGTAQTMSPWRLYPGCIRHVIDQARRRIRGSQVTIFHLHFPLIVDADHGVQICTAGVGEPVVARVENVFGGTKGKSNGANNVEGGGQVTVGVIQ